MVAIIDYGMGNVASVQKALNFLKIENKITSNHEEIKNAHSLILPGVGSFMQGMKNLSERGLDEILTEEVMINKKKFLGICLGMQLIMENGNEPMRCSGLGWIKGSVVKFEGNHLRIPHMGWNDINIVNNEFYNQNDPKDFYFIHSYYVVPENKEVIAATAFYGLDFVASINYRNIFTTQFHPEKSQAAGLNVLKSFFLHGA
ncbi:MAG: imidazole glycerol phosphate synthase subunit HisH [Bacteroidetes bacterium]|nr:imidazole glycerol phosphate synthase subunit HisH [Bacteroidota bacterium]